MSKSDFFAIVLSQKKQYRTQLLLLLCGLLLSMVISLGFGSVHVSVNDIWRILLFKTTGIRYGEWKFSTEQIIWMIRTPRILFTMLVGGGLALTGAVMQAVVRNSIADPYILGLSSGASTGAALVLLSGVSGYCATWAVPLSSFVGAFAAFVLVFVIAGQKGTMGADRLILAGVAISYLFSSCTSFLTFLSPDQGLREITHWLLGSVAGGKWTNILLPSFVVTGGCFFFFVKARALNSISMGEETAVSLGLNSSLFRKQIFLVTALVVGVIVSLSGSIGFVGLMIPHIARLLVGNDHKKLLPLSFLAGSFFLIWADVIARTVMSPMELPIGIVTAIFGAPFFIWLLNKKGGES